MSWFSSALKKVGNGVKAVGHTVGSIQSNPWVEGLEAAALGATGVGAPAAAALLAANGAISGAIKPGGNLKSAALGGVEGAGAGYGGDKLGAALDAGYDAGGISGAAKAVIPGASTAAAGGGTGAAGPQTATDTPESDYFHTPGPGSTTSPQSTQGPTSLLGAFGNYIAGHPGVALNTATGLLSAAQAAKQQGLANTNMNASLANTQAQWNAQAGLRSQALATLQNPGANVNLTSVQQAAGQGNPFAQKPAAGPTSATPAAGRPLLPYQTQAMS